jgi:hypothetical protein
MLLQNASNYLYDYDISGSHNDNDTDVGILCCPDNRGSIFLSNVGIHLQVHIVLQLRRSIPTPTRPHGVHTKKTI